MFMTASLRTNPAGTYSPVLVDLIERISAEHALTVFTVIPPDGCTESYTCGNAEVRVVSARFDDSVFRRAYRFTRAFLSIHRTNPFQLVHGFWATPGGLAAVGSGMLAGLPSVVTLQGGEAASLPSIGYGNMSRFSSRMLTLWVCRQAGVLTALTQFHASAIKSQGLRRDVRVIPYGASPAFFCGSSDIVPQLPVRFLHVADLNRVKDQETLLRAFAILARKLECSLTIAGRDILGGHLERLAVELGIREKTRFLGYVPHSQLPSLYFSSDFLLHTSLYEAQAVVVSEACAAGCVVCGTRVGLVADLEATCVVAVPPANPESLAGAVLELLEHPAHYLELRAAAKAWAVEHDAAWTARQFLNLYGELLNF
jgi:glycosyltransferase involved in cell wall biosynthesis